MAEIRSGQKTRGGKLRGVAMLAAVSMLFLAGDNRVVRATHGLPHATVKVWDTAPVLGVNPDESVEDIAGLTAHGTGAPTIVTTYENTTHPFGPCGVSYWNPDTNVFVDYGKTFGFQTSVDLNNGGPLEAGGPFGSSFGPGDTWMGGQMSEPLYMQIHGTDNFRTYFVDQTWGVEVDEATGDVFFTEPSPGNIARLDPTTNLVTRWTVGGNPAYVTLDGSGRPYATLSSSNEIARVNPGADGTLGTADDTVTRWSVPGPASFVPVPGPFETPNGITRDSSGNIWFAESNSNEVGRLNPATNEICEYTKPGLVNPQLIASTGAGGLLQAFFAEGAGNSVSVLTQVEADNPANPGRVCAIVPPVTAPLPPTAFVPSVFDEVVPPRTFTILPTTFDVPGLDGSASGGTTTPDGLPIPPILRFSPMPGGGGFPFPSGMTGVYAPLRIAGAYLFASKHFEVKSGAIIAPPPGQLEGRMTGGGSVFTGTGMRVTHGFELHCDATTAPNNLEVNAGGERFHLESLTSAACSDDPAISELPPTAGFDTYKGEGTGRWNGVSGATAKWTFKDAGEPGKSVDVAEIEIKVGPTVVLSVSGTLNSGNHQAHKE